MKTRTKTYYTTVPNNISGKEVIAEIRKEVKIFNLGEKIKALKDPGYIRKTQKGWNLRASREK